MIKENLIKVLLKLVTVPLRIRNSETKTPDNYKSFEGAPALETEKDLVLCYRKLFSEPPWFEDWKVEEVKEKVKKDLMHSFSFLTIMKGDKEFPIGGFSWGAIIDTEELGHRIQSALSINKKEATKITEYLTKRKVNKVLYFDELGVLKRFRGGTDPLRFLTLKGFEKAVSKGVKEAIFWSTEGSKIVPIMKMMGFEKIAQVKTSGREIIFLLNNNFRPLLKIAQNISHNKVTKLLRVASSLT